MPVSSLDLSNPQNTTYITRKRDAPVEYLTQTDLSIMKDQNINIMRLGKGYHNFLNLVPNQHKYWKYQHYSGHMTTPNIPVMSLI